MKKKSRRKLNQLTLVDYYIIGILALAVMAVIAFVTLVILDNPAVLVMAAGIIIIPYILGVLTQEILGLN